MSAYEITAKFVAQNGGITGGQLPVEYTVKVEPEDNCLTILDGETGAVELTYASLQSIAAFLRDMGILP